MSRADSHDFEYPPGLGFLRNGSSESAGTVHHPNPSASSFSPADRRSSAPLAPYSLYSSGPRSSVGLSDWDLSEAAPNRHSPAASAGQSFSSFNHHHRPAQTFSSNSLFSSATTFNDRDPSFARQSLHSPPTLPQSPTAGNRSTLWWGDLEPWMDEEYAKQVCSLMGWDPINIKVPHPPPDVATGQQPNNPGYCFLTFGSPAQAAAVLAQINNSGSPSPITMPNSTKPFLMNWASQVQSAATVNPSFSASAMPSPQQYPKEYSIFVGDLAPETSNSDLVAVFRNPVLGLRNDREPKFIRPFLSCKSAKIMLDPVTGVSRGYGFVRFTDEADQQRALIEMHGLYCLSRPMRISPATAKFKAPQPIAPHELPQVQFPPPIPMMEPVHQPVTIAVPLPPNTQAKSVSAPIAAGSSLGSISSVSSNSLGQTSSVNPMSTATSATSLLSSFPSSEDMLNLPTNVLAQIAQQYASGDSPVPKQHNPGTSITAPFAQDGQPRQGGPASEGPQFMISEESWKHHAQARAILGNLIGPNGEQLTSTDPYNTTVFVGGLSPLISEETLRTFFAPFGDIHYVKVPVGKHCGFVQFVRKTDAERAIEKMQGFPVGGSRIRLSWGRSQYKAAQAAAQAAQAAAMQGQFPATNPSPPTNTSLTRDQALQILQKFAMQGYVNSSQPDITASEAAAASAYINGGSTGSLYGDEKLRAAMLTSREDIRPFDNYSSMQAFAGHSSESMASPIDQRQKPMTSFSPFSPDPNLFNAETRREFTSREGLPHPSKAYAPGFFTSSQPDDSKSNGSDSSSTPGPRPSSAARYGPYLSSSSVNRAPGRPEGHMSRPSSGQIQKDRPVGQELDSMHDLNGTLASLDLDRDRPWKSPAESSESSSGSVQFRMTSSPSP